MAVHDYLMPSIDIPELFYSEKTTEPFSECSLCGKILAAEDTYIIEKSFKRNKSTKQHELIYEYALCSNCQENMRTELSQESLKNIEMYYKLYVDFEKRYADIMESRAVTDLNVDDWVSRCLITNKELAQEDEYTIGAQIHNGLLVFGAMPFALGKKAIYEMQEILSKTTKDILDGFQNEIFPPETREKLPDGRLILL